MWIIREIVWNSRVLFHTPKWDSLFSPKSIKKSLLSGISGSGYRNNWNDCILNWFRYFPFPFHATITHASIKVNKKLLLLVLLTMKLLFTFLKLWFLATNRANYLWRLLNRGLLWWLAGWHCWKWWCLSSTGTDNTNVTDWFKRWLRSIDTIISLTIDIPAPITSNILKMCCIVSRYL